MGAGHLVKKKKKKKPIFNVRMSQKVAFAKPYIYLVRFTIVKIWQLIRERQWKQGSSLNVSYWQKQNVQCQNISVNTSSSSTISSISLVIREINRRQIITFRFFFFFFFEVYADVAVHVAWKIDKFKSLWIKLTHNIKVKD